MSRTIWISRHGNRVDFVNPDWGKTADVPTDPGLSPDGITQARLLGLRLKDEGIRHIFCSPFLRAVETANQVAEILDLPIKIEKGLSEWLNSDWYASPPILISLEIKKRMYSRIDTTYISKVIPKHPESWDDIRERAARTAEALTKEFEGDLLLIGHGASVETVTEGLLGVKGDIESSLCCLVKLVREEDKWVMELNGDTSHLDSMNQSLRREEL